MRWTAAAVFILIGAPAFAKDFDENAARQYCKNSYHSDFAKQERCFDGIYQGYWDTVHTLTYFKDPANLFADAFQNCRDRWGIRWDEVHTCIQTQISAAQAGSLAIKRLPAMQGAVIFGECWEDRSADLNEFRECAIFMADRWERENP